MSAKNVWVIEQAEYSDYRVVGVFSSKENAERVLKAINNESSWGTPTIAEWPLDPACSELNAGLHTYRVLMLRDGSTEIVGKVEITGYVLNGEEHLWRRSQAPAYKGTGKQDALDMTVWASDEQHAIKIVNERRGQLIATGEWA